MTLPRALAMAAFVVLFVAALLGSGLGTTGSTVKTVEGPATVVDERTLTVAGETAELWGLEPLPDPQPARQTLASLVDGHPVWCKPVTEGDHAPMRCFVANENIAILLLARGEARTTATLRGGEKDWVRGYKTAEAQAQHAHLGLWRE